MLLTNNLEGFLLNYFNIEGRGHAIKMFLLITEATLKVLPLASLLKIVVF
jgi:hypothetical protein